MTKGKKVTQLMLMFFGFFLILATYFLYPKLNKNVLEKNKIVKNDIIEKKDGEDINNTFTNVEYNGVYSLKNDFKVKSEKAYITEEKPDIVFMTNMKVVINMNDGRQIFIESDKGRYNKRTFDCFFIDNVKARDEKTLIEASNLDLLATEDLVRVYNDVILKNENGSLRADKINYDFETRYYQISMFNSNEKIKMKLIQWVV